MAGKRPKPPGKKTKKPSKQELRIKAQFRGFTRYIQRAGSRIRDIWESERIGADDEAPLICDVVPLNTFQGWARDGQWRSRRDEHWVEVRQRVMAHAKTEAVQAEIAEMAQLEGLKDVVMTRIMGDSVNGIDPAMPKSLEGAVGAFVSLDKRVSQKRDLVLDASIRAASTDRESDPALTGGKGPLHLGSDMLRQRELDAMSRALAETRAITADEPDDKPLEGLPHPALQTKEEEEEGGEE
jgi:hypothetical protein